MSFIRAFIWKYLRPEGKQYFMWKPRKVFKTVNGVRVNKWSWGWQSHKVVRVRSPYGGW